MIASGYFCEDCKSLQLIETFVIIDSNELHIKLECGHIYFFRMVEV
jgi:hypothetical protein